MILQVLAAGLSQLTYTRVHIYVYISIKYSTVCTLVVGLNTPDAVFAIVLCCGTKVEEDAMWRARVSAHTCPTTLKFWRVVRTRGEET